MIRSQPVRLFPHADAPLGNRDRTRRPDRDRQYPQGNAIFATSPLPAWIFGPLALGAVALLLAEEVRKFIVNRFKNGRAGGADGTDMR